MLFWLIIWNFYESCMHSYKGLYFTASSKRHFTFLVWIIMNGRRLISFWLMWQKAITTGGSTFNWDYQCWIFHPIKPGSTSLIGNDVYNILQNTTGYFETKYIENHQWFSKLIFSMIKDKYNKWELDESLAIRYLFFEFHINVCPFRFGKQDCET